MTEIIINPSENDVLCGRGGATNNHEGNRRFRMYVSENQPAYLQAKKREKSLIAGAVVDIIRKQGGRFLRKIDDRGNGWIEVGDKKAIEKTSQALREGLDVRTIFTKNEKKIAPPQSYNVSPKAYDPRKRQRTNRNQLNQLNDLENMPGDINIEGLPTNYIDNFNEDPNQGCSSSIRHKLPIILTNTTTSYPNYINDWKNDKSPNTVIGSKSSHTVDCEDVVAV